jgi:hypothetical protein
VALAVAPTAREAGAQFAVYTYNADVMLLAGATPEDTTFNFVASGNGCYNYSVVSITGTNTFRGYFDGVEILTLVRTEGLAWSTATGPVIDSLTADRPSTANEVGMSANWYARGSRFMEQHR